MIKFIYCALISIVVAALLCFIFYTYVDWSIKSIHDSKFNIKNSADGASKNALAIDFGPLIEDAILHMRFWINYYKIKHSL